MKNQRIIADGLACLMTAFCITSCSSGDILKKFGSLEMQEYLCENFDANEDHKLSAQEVALITEVDLWSDIKSLEGVKYLKNLEDFSFDHCPSATIDLSKNECLRDFSCSFSENLKVIKMPKSIQSIGLYENAVYKNIEIVCRKGQKIEGVTYNPDYKYCIDKGVKITYID